jgi:hypothetical protein
MLCVTGTAAAVGEMTTQGAEGGVALLAEELTENQTTGNGATGKSLREARSPHATAAQNLAQAEEARKCAEEEEADTALRNKER